MRTTWCAELEKADGTVLGMDVACYDTVVLVEKVHEDGAAAAFNESHPELAISAGDYILSVNNVEGMALGMLEEAKQSTTLKLELCRAKPFRAKIIKEGHLGATFCIFERIVVVQAIQQGPVQDWNDDNPQWQLKVGDQIVEVNGMNDVAVKVLETLKEAKDLDLLVLPLGSPLPATFA